MGHSHPFSIAMLNYQRVDDFIPNPWLFHFHLVSLKRPSVLDSQIAFPADYSEVFATCSVRAMEKSWTARSLVKPMKSRQSWISAFFWYCMSKHLRCLTKSCQLFIAITFLAGDLQSTKDFWCGWPSIGAVGHGHPRVECCDASGRGTDGAQPMWGQCDHPWDLPFELPSGDST